MWNIFNQGGLFFRASCLYLPSLSLSTILFKKLTIKFILFYLLLFINPTYSQIDTLTGIGYAKLKGDPFNVSIIARNRAISNAISQERIKVTSTTILEKSENGSKLKEFISSESNVMIENWEVIESKILKSGFVKSIVKIYVKNPQDQILKENINGIKNHIKKSRNSTFEIKLRELINAYNLIKKYKINKNDLNEDLVINEIKSTLSNIKITKTESLVSDKQYLVIEDGKINNEINIRKVEEETGKVIYVTVDLGILNYQLLRMGLDIPFVKDNA